MLNEIAEEVHETVKSKGLYDRERGAPELLCLIHLEVSEALEADREGNYYKTSPVRESLVNCPDEGIFQKNYEINIKGSFDEEMADIILRVLDLCAYKKIDIDLHVRAKMRYNKNRGRKHNKAY